MEFSDSFSTQVISSNYSNFILSLGIVQILGALVDIPILVSLLILSTYSRRTVTNLRIYENNRIYSRVIGRICEWYSGLNSNFKFLRILLPSAPLTEFRLEKIKNAKI